jgi:simple sugar transport system substrate-binding protein
MYRRTRWTAFLLPVLLALVACSSGDGETSSAETDAGGGGDQAAGDEGSSSDLSFGMAVHANPGESGFWNVVQTGAEAAAEELGVDVTVQGNADAAIQADQVRNFIAGEVDGIVVSLANPDALSPPVQEAVEAGIPVITINSGIEQWQELGAITHVGQSETIAGEGAGRRLNEEGLSDILCIVHEEGNIGLEQRCDGLESTFDGTVERYNVGSTGTQDIQGTQSAILNKLTDDESVDGMMALNPDIAVAARDARDEAGRDDVGLATFDLSPDVLSAIESGEMLFAVDQQQYLQGYLPIEFLKLYNENLNTVGGGQPVLTGPGFVDESNASQVIELAEAGTR